MRELAKVGLIFTAMSCGGEEIKRFPDPSGSTTDVPTYHYDEAALADCARSIAAEVFLSLDLVSDRMTCMMDRIESVHADEAASVAENWGGIPEIASYGYSIRACVDLYAVEDRCEIDGYSLQFFTYDDRVAQYHPAVWAAEELALAELPDITNYDTWRMASWAIVEGEACAVFSSYVTGADRDAIHFIDDYFLLEAELYESCEP